MNTQSNFFTSNSDDTWYNNAYTRTAGVVLAGAVVVAGGYYGYKAIRSSGTGLVPAIGNVAGSAAQAANAAAGSAAELTHALVSTL